MTSVSTLSASARLSSMFLDHVIMSFVAAVIGLATFVTTFLVLGKWVSSDSAQFVSVITGLVLVLYVNKDWFGGQSLAKRISGQRIVMVQSGVPANPLHCFLRNITILIWPLEVLVTISNPSRRLGDRLAGTMVVRLEHSGAHLRQNANWSRSVLTPVFTIILSCTYVTLLLYANSRWGWLDI